LAHVYLLSGRIPQAGNFIWGIRPAVVAVMIAAIMRLGKPLVKNRFTVVTAVVVAMMSLFRVDEILLLIGSGALGLAWNQTEWSKGRTLSAMAPILFIPEAPAGTAASLGSLGLFFLKIGSILYGSGYVLVAFLQGGLVDARHWLTAAQLLDAIAVGQ